MATSLLRLKVVRTADAQNDQKTPLEITGAPTTPVTQEEFQELLLSQIKRIIFGSATGNWYSNFGSLGVESLAQLSAILASRVVGESLAGAINGTNTVFTTASKFVHVVGGLSIQVYMNGQRLVLTDDYTLSESGGPGTGFDTVTLLTAPRAGDKVFADYTKES